MPEGASELDWNYKHVSKNKCMVLNAYLNTDPMKIIDESKEQWGSEAYRLLSHILALSSWTVKGRAQI